MWSILTEGSTVVTDCIATSPRAAHNKHVTRLAAGLLPTAQTDMLIPGDHEVPHPVGIEIERETLRGAGRWPSERVRR